MNQLVSLFMVLVFMLEEHVVAVLLAIVFGVPFVCILWDITAGVVRLVRRRRERQVMLTSMVFRRL